VNTKEKKNLLVSYQYPPIVGGAGIVARDSARLLHQKYNVTVVTLDKGHKIEEDFTVIQAKTLWPFRFFGMWQTLKGLDLEQFDNILINDTGASLVAALYFPKQIQEKCWVYLHGSEPENIYLKPELMMRVLRFKRKYTALLQNSKTIIAVSEYMKQKFTRLTHLTNLESKITVITNGIDKNVFSRLDCDLRKKHNIPNSSKIMLSVSRITPQKGYLRKLRIFKQLVEKHSLFWIVIGSGPFAKELQTAIENENLQDSILIISGLKREQLVEYYSNSDLFWLLSEYDESFGLVYLEANFCGCPAIGNNKGGVPYIITDAENGFIVDLKDDVSASKIIENALYNGIFTPQKVVEYVAHFSLQKMSEKLEQRL
jgi:glycosyltransferase involved in cell wall biosynthesis